MKKKGTKQKSKTKGSENAFGCDLTEHLQNSGQDGKILLFYSFNHENVFKLRRNTKIQDAIGQHV